MTTLVEFMIVAGADNRPPMLAKSLYFSRESPMEFYMENTENKIMILDSVLNGLLVWTTIVQEDGTTRKKTYAELSASEKLQAHCDCKATNIVFQGLPPDVYAIVNHHKVTKEILDRVKLLMQGAKLSLQENEFKLYDEFDKFSFMKGLAVPVFSQGVDPNACLNKAMDFLTAIASSSDDVSNAKVVLMANLSNYGSNVISEVPHFKPYHNDMDNQITVDRGRKTEETAKRRAENAITCKVYSSLKERKKKGGLKVHLPKSSKVEDHCCQLWKVVHPWTVHANNTYDLRDHLCKAAKLSKKKGLIKTLMRSVRSSRCPLAIGVYLNRILFTTSVNLVVFLTLTQRFDELFSEAWDRFNDLLRVCPHHGFSELHQLDTFYNALNINDQDSLNSAAGRNFLDKMPADCLKIIESKSKVRQTRAKAVVTKPLAYQASTYQAPVSQTQSVSQNDFERYIKASDAVLRNIQNQGQSTQNQCQSTQNQLQTVQNQLANLTDMMAKFMSANTASSLGLGTLPGNTVTNPKEDLKGIITRSGVAYQGPTTPTPSKVANQGTEVTKDQVQLQIHK
nr:reverse transcriptase domain-containing protein [Tanacetum cinerariifolium]